MLWRTHPENAEKLMQKAQEGVMERFHHYEQLASLSYGKADEGEKS
jgi:pyruvate-ferredoxin/flavodoxin oxidoreductase